MSKLLRKSVEMSIHGGAKVTLQRAGSSAGDTNWLDVIVSDEAGETIFTLTVWCADSADEPKLDIGG